MRALLLASALSGCAPATITLLAPQEGDTLCGDELPVVVEVQGLTLSAPVASEDKAEPRTGHVDLTLNGQDFTMFWTDETVLRGVEPGVYLLAVELSDSLHDPIEPPARDEVLITVDDAACL